MNDLVERVKEAIANGFGCNRTCSAGNCGCEDDARAAVALCRDEAVKIASDMHVDRMTASGRNPADYFSEALEVAAALRKMGGGE